MKKIPAAPGRAVVFARSPPAGAFAGFVYYSALFPGRRLFPPVEQHPQHAAAGGQHQADPQRHIAAVPGLGAAGSRCRDGFSLHIFTDRTAALSGTFFGLGGLFGYFPIAVGMVCHIQLFTAGAFLPVLGFVIFPRFIMDAVLMPGDKPFKTKELSKQIKGLHLKKHECFFCFHLM